MLLNCVGLALTRLQRSDETPTVLEESVALDRETSERLLEAHALTALADVSLRLDGTGTLAIRTHLGDDAGSAEPRRRLVELETAAR